MLARSLLIRIGADHNDQRLITVSSSAWVKVLQCSPLCLLTSEQGVFPMMTISGSCQAPGRGAVTKRSTSEQYWEQLFAFTPKSKLSQFAGCGSSTQWGCPAPTSSMMPFTLSHVSLQQIQREVRFVPRHPDG